MPSESRSYAPHCPLVTLMLVRRWGSHQRGPVFTRRILPLSTAAIPGGETTRLAHDGTKNGFGTQRFSKSKDTDSLLRRGGV